MNCPRLPTLPNSTVSRIDPSWFRDLHDCLRYAMTHPTGDGVTIFNESGGTLRVDLPCGGEGGSAAATSPVESSGYSGEFKVSVGEIARREDETGDIVSLELFIRNGLYEGYDNTYPNAGWVLLAGKRVAKTAVYHGTLWKDNYNLANIYVWHETYFHPVDGIRTTYVFTEEDKFPTEENGTYTVVYDLLAVIRDGKVIQAHYGPIHIMDRYYDETVTE